MTVLFLITSKQLWYFRILCDKIIFNISLVSNQSICSSNSKSLIKITRKQDTFSPINLIIFNPNV